VVDRAANREGKTTGAFSPGPDLARGPRWGASATLSKEIKIL